MPNLQLNLEEKPKVTSPNIKRKVAYWKFLQTRNKFASCSFIKRTNGEERYMHFRWDPLDEEADRWQALQKGLVLVFDLQKQEPRFINLDGLLWLKANGQQFHFIIPSPTKHQEDE